MNAKGPKMDNFRNRVMPYSLTAGVVSDKADALKASLKSNLLASIAARIGKPDEDAAECKFELIYLTQDALKRADALMRKEQALECKPAK